MLTDRTATHCSGLDRHIHDRRTLCSGRGVQAIASQSQAKRLRNIGLQKDVVFNLQRQSPFQRQAEKSSLASEQK